MSLKASYRNTTSKRSETIEIFVCIKRQGVGNGPNKPFLLNKKHKTDLQSL